MLTLPNSYQQVKKVNWYRITIKDDDSNNVGKIDIYNDDDGSWEEDSTIENETNLIPRTSYWMFGEKGDKIKGQWGSRGTRTGVMDIKSIFLSVLPNPPIFNGYHTRTIYDVLARVEFTGQTEHDIIYFQKNSKDRMFKKFEEAFNETKNVDDKVSFEFEHKDYYYVLDHWPDYGLASIRNVNRNQNNGRTNTNETRSPAYTNAQDAWNGLFCFDKVDSTWGMNLTGDGSSFHIVNIPYADLLAIKE